MDTEKPPEQKSGEAPREGTPSKPPQTPPQKPPQQPPQGPPKQPSQAPQQPQSNVRHIVRVAGVDLEGKKTVKRSLRKIKGVGIPLANAIINIAGLQGKKTGELTESEIKRIEEILNNPTKAGVPVWMINRQRDYETGDDIHLHGADLQIYKRFDVSRLQKAKSYKGIRHALGLKLRGQRTRSTGRKGKTLGVQRRGSKQPASAGGKK